MEPTSLVKKITELVSPTVDSLGCELIEVEHTNEGGGWIVRLYIDREGGVTLENCETVSKAVSALLDVEDIIPGRFTLEVSSPGIPRPLRRPKDFKRFIGQEVKIRTLKKIDGCRNFIGTLIASTDDSITVDVDGKISNINIDDILKARLRDTKLHGGKKNG